MIRTTTTINHIRNLKRGDFLRQSSPQMVGHRLDDFVGPPKHVHFPHSGGEAIKGWRMIWPAN
jgi:hypothetical protein